MAERLVWTHGPGHFLEELRQRKFWLVLIALLALTKAIGYWPPILRLADGANRFVQNLTRTQAKYTRLVLVDGTDFANTFGNKEKTAIDPARLFGLIESIDRCGPVVIAIDFDTTSTTYARLKIPTTNAKLVWARGVLEHEIPKGGRFTEEGLLGGRQVTLDILYGLVPITPNAETGTVTSYTRRFLAIQEHDSFPWVVAKTFAEKNPKEHAAVRDRKPDAHEQIWITPHDFSPIPFFPARVAANCTVPSPDILQGKVVVLGGIYGSDFHATRHGLMSGASILANAIETELQGEFPTSLHWSIELTIKLGIALLISFFNACMFPRWAAISAATVIVGLILGTSAIYAWSGLWLNFVFLAVAVWIEHLVEVSIHAQRMAEELHKRGVGSHA